MQSAFNNTRPKSSLLFRAALMLIVVAFLAINLQWMAKYRFGGLLEIDEAGYLSLSTSYARALLGGGVPAWLSAINSPNAHAPLLPALTSLILASSTLSVDMALLTNSLVCAALIILIQALCQSLGGRQTSALLVAVFAATTPALVDYSRNYHYAAITSLCYTGAALSMIKARGFHSKLWSVMLGIFIGALVLSRTMTIAFLPCFAIASLFSIVTHGNTKAAAAWRNVGLAALAFFAVALSWYASHYQDVFQYLFSFGYGANSTEYGGHIESGYSHVFLARLNSLMDLYLRPMHFLILIPLFCLAGLSSIVFLYQGTRPEKYRDVATCSVLVMSSFLALASSSNAGTAFELPLVCTAMAVAFCGLDLFELPRLALIVIRSALIIAMAPSVYAQTDVAHCANLGALPEQVSIPFFGDRRAYDCRGTIHLYVSTGGLHRQADGNTGVVPISMGQASEWQQLSEDVASYLYKHVAPDSQVAFATRHHLFNVNTVQLESLARFGRAWRVSQIEPTILANDEKRYTAWLNTVVKQSACTVITSDTVRGEFAPAPNLDFLASALQATNFRKVDVIEQPGKAHRILIWRRSASACEHPPAAVQTL